MFTDGTKKFEKAAFVALALLLLSLCVNAALPLVSIQPKNNTVAEAYPFEVVELSLNISNNSGEAIDNLWLRLTANEGAALIKGDTELNERDFQPISLNAGESLNETILAKALMPLGVPPKISAEFGLGAYTNSSSVVLQTIESPLSFNASPKKTMFSKGEKGEIALSLSNDGSEEAKDITAKIEETDYFAPADPVFSLQSLAPKQLVKEASVFFTALNESPEKRNIVLQIEFTDSRGKHVLEKAFEAGVQERTSLVLVVIGAIIVLAALGLYLDAKNRKEEIKKISLLEEKGA
ncbi:MAG: hypothetical protein V1494_04010 [Candidatus Diapherotrites archaeon]